MNIYAIKHYHNIITKRKAHILFVLISCLFSSLMCNGQSMSIASFKMDEADQTANVSPTMRMDVNGEKCALIKIATTQKNFSFDVGSLGVTEIEWQNTDHPGEIWLYVPNGAMKISIQHPQFGSIKDYDFGSRLKKGRTYVMDLTSDKVNTLVVDYENSQILEIEVFPSDADFYINGLKQRLDRNGRTSITLPFGTHSYRGVASNYHPTESQVVINNKNNKQSLSVHLKPAFGYLNINATPESRGGEVYIDDTKIGSLPISKFPLKSGMHKLSVYQKLFSPYTEQIAMTDDGSISITPILKPNYAEYEITVDGDNGAKIYCDGEYLGIGGWKGKLEAGDHILAVTKDRHRSNTEKIQVVKDTPRKVSLSRPMPIYGTLEITTQPRNASVYIDNNTKPAGQTNYVNRQLLIGSHHIKLVLPGYKTEEFDVNIKDGQLERVNKTLTDYCNATIYSTPNANVSIDGIQLGKTPVRINKTAGVYQVKLTAHGYTTYSKKMYLDGNTKDISIKLQRNYTRPNEFYAQVGVNIGGLLAFNVGAGAYYHNINLEANYLLGINDSEKIYWTNKTGKTDPFSATYKATGWNLKVGYGLRLHSRVRLTPQLGCQSITLKEIVDNDFSLKYPTLSQYYNYSGAADGANVASFNGGLRCNVALTSWLGISISPEYLIGVGRSKGFEALSKVSSQIKGYANGFNCNVSFNIVI